LDGGFIGEICLQDLSLVGVCGLYCGACIHYRSSVPGGEHLIPSNIRDNAEMIKDFTCKGCRSDDLYIHSGCRDCGIRKCSGARKFDHCGDCEEVPCQDLTKFQNDGRKHHEDIGDNLMLLNGLGVDKWLYAQEKKWTCGCGKPFSWYEVKCEGCGKYLNSYVEN